MATMSPQRSAKNANADHLAVVPEPEVHGLEAQERALTWASSRNAPIRTLVGWNPETGVWDDGSPIAEMLAVMRRGAHFAPAAKQHDVRRFDELVSRGRRLLADANVSEDRLLIPVEDRLFVDLALHVDRTEAEAENRLAEVVYRAALYDPRLALKLLALRFPQNWDGRPKPVDEHNQDPNGEAITKLMAEDPGFALQMAELAEWTEDRMEAQDKASGQGSIRGAATSPN
jgi:hypothetical protein